MGFKKTFAAIVLASSMLFATAASAATTSPVEPPAPTTYVDKNTAYHNGSTVVSTVNAKGTTATVTKAYANNNKSASKTVNLKNAKNAKGKAVPITVVGNGKTGILNTKKGKKVTTLKLSSKKKMTVKANAFKGSKIKKVIVNTKVSLKKNAFKSTGVKNPTITINVKKASYVTVAKGAFTGLNKKAKIVVSKKKMTSAQFKILKKKLVKAGFKGTITRK